MKQILIIHGGTSFSSYEAYRQYLDEKVLNIEKLSNPLRWKEHLAEQLPDYQVLYPSMPNSTNAVFDEWAVYFNKLIALLGDDAQVIGHSLGAMFLAKYLNKHVLEKPLKRIHLVAGGFDDDSVEDLGSFQVLSAKNVANSAEEIHLYHSKDDPVVPFAELAKFRMDLPTAHAHVFDNRGHFIDETFPEILELLKQKK